MKSSWVYLHHTPRRKAKNSNPALKLSKSNSKISQSREGMQVGKGGLNKATSIKHFTHAWHVVSAQEMVVINPSAIAIIIITVAHHIHIHIYIIHIHTGIYE